MNADCGSNTSVTNKHQGVRQEQLMIQHANGTVENEGQPIDLHCLRADVQDVSALKLRFFK